MFFEDSSRLHFNVEKKLFHHSKECKVTRFALPLLKFIDEKINLTDKLIKFVDQNAKYGPQ